MARSIKQEKRKRLARKTFRRKNGGKAFGSNDPVSLYFNDSPVTCDCCKQNIFEESAGTINKSKVATFFASSFFGNLGEQAATTSVNAYFCKNCGLSKMVRNDGNTGYIKAVTYRAQAQQQAQQQAPVQVQEQQEAQSKEQEQRKPEQTAPNQM